MIFYFNAKGESLGITPERIFQGSRNSTVLTMVGAVAEVDVVSATFEFSDGLKTENVVFVRDENFSACNLKDELNNNFTAWSCDLPASVSAESGLVSVQFYITSPNGDVAATAKVNFDVEDGVDCSEPLKTDTYAQVLTALSSLKAQVDKSGGASALLYKYTVNGTFVDHANNMTLKMTNVSFITYERIEPTSQNLRNIMKNSLRYVGGYIDGVGESYVGREVPFAVGSGYGINSIALIEQSSLQCICRIFEEITLTDYVIEEIQL